jgi:hypothetical protein
MFWAWDIVEQRLVETKIDYVRQVILAHLRHEAAYFRHLQRAEFPGESLSDWVWAETTIADLA